MIVVNMRGSWIAITCLTFLSQAAFATFCRAADEYGLKYFRFLANQAGSTSLFDDLVIQDLDANTLFYSNDFNAGQLDDLGLWFLPERGAAWIENSPNTRVEGGQLRLETAGFQQNGNWPSPSYDSNALMVLEKELPANFELQFTARRLQWAGRHRIDFVGIDVRQSDYPPQKENGLNENLSVTTAFEGDWSYTLHTFHPTKWGSRVSINGLQERTVRFVKQGATLDYYVDGALVDSVVLERFQLPGAVWDQAGPGAFDYEDALNWRSGILPNSTTDASFPLNGVVDVLLSGDHAAKSLVVSDGTLTFLGDAGGRLAIAEDFTVSDASAASSADGVQAAVAASVQVSVAQTLYVGRDGIATLEVRDDAAIDAARLWIGSGVNAIGALQVLPGARAVISSSAEEEQLVVGENGGAGSIDIQGGSFTSVDGASTARIGGGEGARGTVSVTGGGELRFGSVELGVAGEGTLLIAGAGSLADLTAEEPLDDTLTIGASGAGTLHAFDGGVVLSEVGVVGEGPAAVGNVHVSGGGSAWQTNLLTIGVQGTAEVAIDHGGRLATVLDAYVARQDGSNAQLTVGGEGQAQSVFHVGDGLYVGGDQGSSGGTASVDVLPNGRVEVAQNLTVRPQGRVAVQGGALVVDGDVVLKGELALLSGALSVGQIPAAQQGDFQDLFSWNAGTLTLTGQGLRIDAEGPLGATVNLVPGKALVTEGGGLDNQGLLNVVSTSAAFRGGASVNSPTGTINVTEGTLEVAEGLVNEGTLTLFDASMVGSVANAVGSEATLSGSNSVTGAYAMGPLNSMSVRVRSQSNASRLDVGGLATLDGTLNVTLIGGYVPTLGQRIAFVDAGELVGEFATENLPAQREGVAFYVNYTDTTASLLTTYPTDFSADGEVGDADFARWESGFGPRAVTYKFGDANEDGAADGFDLLALQRQFGLAVPASAQGTTVPEPGLLVALTALLPWRMRCGKS